jgi:hypothetical protein
MTFVWTIKVVRVSVSSRYELDVKLRRVAHFVDKGTGASILDGSELDSDDVEISELVLVTDEVSDDAEDTVLTEEDSPVRDDSLEDSFMTEDS